MADREKVIKGLECCVLRDPDDKHQCDDCPYRHPDGVITNSPCANGLMGNALSLLKAQEPGWISVKERLPERAGKYLVVSKTVLAGLLPHVKTALFLNNLRDNPQFEYDGEPNESGFYNGDGEGDWVERYVTHWMPLPEPPKEG